MFGNNNQIPCMYICSYTYKCLYIYIVYFITIVLSMLVFTMWLLYECALLAEQVARKLSVGINAYTKTFEIFVLSGICDTSPSNIP